VAPAEDIIAESFGGFFGPIRVFGRVGRQFLLQLARLVM
jgi:hypothetical protein